MRQYHDLVQEVYETGHVVKNDRTGTGMIESFGHQMKFDLSMGFPLVNTKRTFFRGAITELLWILSGSTNIRSLQEQKIHIWDEWADENGDLGPTYGYQVRNYNGQGVDQLKNVLHDLKYNPHSRRHIINLWNPVQIDQMRLPPCLAMYQFNVRGDKLNMMVTQRSADLFLGLPFDIAAGAAFVHLVARHVGLQPGILTYSIGSAHIYLNHTEQIELQLSRQPRPLPTLILNEDKIDLFDFTFEDFKLENYNPYPAIKGEVSV